MSVRDGNPLRPASGHLGDSTRARRLGRRRRKRPCPRARAAVVTPEGRGDRATRVEQPATKSCASTPRTVPDRPSPTHSSRPRSSPVGSGDPMRCAGPAGGGAEGDAPGAAGEGGLEERDGANLQPSQPY